MIVGYDVSILEDARFTGVEKLAYYLFQELWTAAPDWRHLLFCRRRPARLVDLPANVDIQEVPGGRLWRYLNLPGAIRRQGVDLFLSPVAALPGPCGCPLVAFVHECQWRHAVGEKGSRYHQWMFRLAAWRAKLLLPISQTTLAEARQELPFAAHPRLEVVSPAADPTMVSAAAAEIGAIRSTLGLPPGAEYCLAVGTVRAKKNIELMIEAFARPELRDLHLVLAGRVDDPAFPAMARQRQLANLHFAGYLDDPAVKALYRHALCLLYVSANEGFGLTLLEAFANHCPVIGSRCGSIPEVGGEAVLYLDRLEPAALATAILALQNQPQTRDNLLRQAAGRLANYSWRASAEKLRDLLAETVAAR